MKAVSKKQMKKPKKKTESIGQSDISFRSSFERQSYTLYSCTRTHTYGAWKQECFDKLLHTINNWNWPKTFYFFGKIVTNFVVVGSNHTHTHSYTNWKKMMEKYGMVLGCSYVGAFRWNHFMLSQLPVWMCVVPRYTIHSFICSSIRSGTLPTFQFHFLLFMIIYDFSFSFFQQLVFNYVWYTYTYLAYSTEIYKHSTIYYTKNLWKRKCEENTHLCRHS